MKDQQLLKGCVVMSSELGVGCSLDLVFVMGNQFDSHAASNQLPHDQFWYTIDKQVVSCRSQSCDQSWTNLKLRHGEEKFDED